MKGLMDLRDRVINRTIVFSAAKEYAAKYVPAEGLKGVKTYDHLAMVLYSQATGKGSK